MKMNAQSRRLLVARGMANAGRLYLAALMLLVAATAAFVVVTLARPTTFLSPDGEDLAESLERTGDGFSAPLACRKAGGDTWTCPVEDDAGSGVSGAYTLRTREGDCWTATRSDRTTTDRLEGCVRLRDYVGF
jgi:hypothetical protein